MLDATMLEPPMLEATMLEVGILGVIALAAAYWMALWLVGRHEDVLYGSFVTPSAGIPGSEPPAPEQHPLQQVARSHPPEQPRRPRGAPSGALPDASAGRPETPVLRTSALRPGLAAVQRSETAGRTGPPQQTELLVSLLETIKRDLGESPRR
jgi:hypothetical protein